MKSRLSYIGIILLLVFLAPAIVLTWLELSSVKQNEAVLKEVYANQLDAVLFSVNNYSQDVAEGWVSQLDKLYQNPGTSIAQELKNILREVSAIRWLFVQEDSMIRIAGKTPLEYAEMSPQIEAFQALQVDTLRRLANYLENGFRKIEPFSYPKIDSLPMLLCYLPRENKAPLLCGIFIDPLAYTRQVLAPRMQEVARQKLIVFIHQQENDQITYSTEPFSQTQLPQYKPLWLMPNYELGIQLKGQSLEALAERRSYSNLFLIIGMNVVLLLGIIWVIRNVRREIFLAQKKSDFVSNVSHEIRTPLSLISMFAETLSLNRVRTEEKKKEYYDIIGQEASRLTRTVNKILNFSKMEAGKRVYHKEDINLVALVSEILYSYDFHLKQLGFEYSFSHTADTLMVHADKEAISEAFINLIDNAINYSEEEKDIQIHCEQKGEKIILRVADKGIGIAEKERKAIFDKFYRVSSAAIHNTKGTGLGLSLVHHIMEAHGGTVTVTSQLGKGSSFSLIFGG